MTGSKKVCDHGQCGACTVLLAHAGAAKCAKFLGGGTNLLDLMKYDVEHPSTLIDVTHLQFSQVPPSPSGGAIIGAGVRNSDLANHEIIRTHYPLLSQALLSGASPNSAIWPPPPAAISSSAPAASTSWTPPFPSATSAHPAPAAAP